MSNVNLTIGGRTFAVACEDGEEQHIADLARMIDQKVVESGAGSGQTESRMLLFGALMLADEVHELRKKSEAQIAPEPAPALVDVSENLAALAEHLENLANWLESGTDNT